MNEPMHQHEMVELLWEYELPFMSNDELLRWAQKGFIAEMMELPEQQLKYRYSYVEGLSEQFSDCMDVYDAM